MTRDELELTEHAALLRMPQERLTIDDLVVALNTGEMIASYPDDRPWPSQLTLGWVEGRPVHVCWARTPDGKARIITAYRPDPKLWDDTFKRRVRR